MKIEIEIDDKLVKKLKQRCQLDVRILVENFANRVLPLLEEAGLAADSGALSSEVMRIVGLKVGHEIFRSATTKKGGENHG